MLQPSYQKHSEWTGNGSDQVYFGSDSLSLASAQTRRLISVRLSLLLTRMSEIEWPEKEAHGSRCSSEKSVTSKEKIAPVKLILYQHSGYKRKKRSLSPRVLYMVKISFNQGCFHVFVIRLIKERGCIRYGVCRNRQLAKHVYVNPNYMWR